jgi:hypothetical protein
MASRIVEFHGATPLSQKSIANAAANYCPFTESRCTKKDGACSLQLGESEPVIICPNRLYENHFQLLGEVATIAFGSNPELVSAIENEKRRRAGTLTGSEIIVFGKHFGKELGIPTPKGLEEGEVGGSFFIDFILAQLGQSGDVAGFAAVEVQTIDTTNSYSAAAADYRSGSEHMGKRGPGLTDAGLNWENVSKRILPQLIYKGHALRREPLCKNGLFFILPHAVFQRIKRRVGGRLLEYPLAAGTITFRTYDLGDADVTGVRPLRFCETLTTTVEQIAFAFVSPQNLPDAGVYQNVIAETLVKLGRKKAL